MLKYIVSYVSPELKKWGNGRLKSVFRFIQQEIIRREQIHKIELPFDLFNAVHTLPECRVVNRYIGMIYNGWHYYDYDYENDATSPVYVRRCQHHNTESQPYVHDGALGDKTISDFRQLVPDAQFIPNSGQAELRSSPSDQ